MFSYVKKCHNTELVFDPINPEVDSSELEFRYWTSSKFGHAMKKVVDLLASMQKPIGIGFLTRVNIVSDHAPDVATRRSRIRFIVYLNSSPTR